jgi:hypothetical protein
MVLFNLAVLELVLEDFALYLWLHILFRNINVVEIYLILVCGTSKNVHLETATSGRNGFERW